jgi:DNA-binding FadR family transcriptional regulator
LAQGVDGVPDFLSADQQIHQYFAKITGNPIYISLFKTMHNNIRRYFDELLFKEESEMRENLQDLESVVAAMKKGDADTACRIVRTHVRRFNNYMVMREQQKKAE